MNSFSYKALFFRLFEMIYLKLKVVSVFIRVMAIKTKLNAIFDNFRLFFENSRGIETVAEKIIKAAMQKKRKKRRSISKSRRNEF